MQLLRKLRNFAKEEIWTLHHLKLFRKVMLLVIFWELLVYYPPYLNINITNCFIGAKVKIPKITANMKKDANGDYKWNNGAKGLKSGWGKNQPKSTDGDCVAMAKGKLESTACDKPANFMCEGRNLRCNSNLRMVEINTYNISK